MAKQAKKTSSKKPGKKNGNPRNRVAGTGKLETDLQPGTTGSEEWLPAGNKNKTA